MPELIPLSTLLDEEEEESSLIPLSILDEEYGVTVPGGAKRVPVAWDRGTNLPASAPVVEPILGIQWLGKANERLKLGFEQGTLDQEAYKIMEAGGAGIEEYLERRKDFQRRSSAANIRGDNWFSQGFYGAMQMLGPMAQGTTEGLAYGLALGGTTAALGQLGPQVAFPEEVVTVPTAAMAGVAVGGANYWRRQGAGSLYADLREGNVPHGVAATVAQTMGVPYSLIEYAQVSKVVPGMKRIIQQKIAEKVKGAVKRNAIRLTADVTSNVGQEVAQEITLAAGEAIAESVSDVGLEGTPLGERLLETTTETLKAMPFILAPGRMVKTAQDVSQQQKVKELENFIESAGKEEAGRQPWSEEQVNQLIEAREELAGLRGHSGRVIMFSKIVGTQESSEYIKIDKNADATSAIIAHELSNPNSVYRGVFDIGGIKVDGQTFNTEAEALDAASQAEAEGDQAQAAKILDATIDAETIEGRMKVEAEYLGEGVLDPVRLGKHRIKARDVKQIIPGEVEETDLGYRVTLENGFKLDVNFMPIADQREAKINSLLSEGKITWEAWEAMSEADQEKELAGWRVAGSFVQAKTKTGEVIPDKFITAFGVTGDVGTFRHEAIHFLRATGLISESEYDTLRKEFAKPQLELETQIRKLEELGDKATEDDQVKLKALKESLDNLQEEDVANGYAAFMHEPGSKNTIFQKVYDFFNGILMVRSAAGLLRRIDQGELASRPKPVAPAEAAEPKLSVQARNEKLVQATKDFEAGEITRAERNRVVAQEKPVVAPERLPVAEDIPTPKFSVQPRLYSRLEEAINNMPQKAATGQEWVGRIKKLRERGTVKGIGMESPEGQSSLEIDWKMPALDALEEGGTYTKEEVLALLRKRDVEVTMKGGRVPETKPASLEVDTYWSPNVIGSTLMRKLDELLEDLPEALPRPVAGVLTLKASDKIIERTTPLTADDVEVYYIRDNTADEDGINPYYLFKFKNFESYLASWVRMNQHEHGVTLTNLAPSEIEHHRERFDEGHDTLAYLSNEGSENGFPSPHYLDPEGTTVGIPFTAGANIDSLMTAIEEVVTWHYVVGMGRDVERPDFEHDDDYHSGSTLTGPKVNGTRIALKVTPDEQQEVPTRQGHFERDELGWSRVDERQLAPGNLDLAAKWKKFRDVWTIFINEIQSDWMQTAGRTVPTLKQEIEKHRKQITVDQKEIDKQLKRIGSGKPSLLQADNFKTWERNIQNNKEAIEALEKKIKTESGEAGFLTAKAKKAWSAIGQSLLTRTTEYVTEGIRPAIDALMEESRRLAAVINEKRESTGYEASMDTKRALLGAATRSQASSRNGLLRRMQNKLKNYRDDVVAIRRSINFIDVPTHEPQEITQQVDLPKGGGYPGTTAKRIGTFVLDEVPTGGDIDESSVTITMDDGTVLRPGGSVVARDLPTRIKEEVANHLVRQVKLSDLEDMIDGWSEVSQTLGSVGIPKKEGDVEREKVIAREILAAMMKNDPEMVGGISTGTSLQGEVETALQSSEDENVAMERADQVFRNHKAVNAFYNAFRQFQAELTGLIKDQESVLGYEAISEMDKLVESTDATILNLEDALERMGKTLSPDKLMSRQSRPEAVADYLDKIRQKFENHRKRMEIQAERLESGSTLEETSLNNYGAVQRIENELSQLGVDMSGFSKLLKSVGQSGSVGVQPDTPLKDAWEQLVAMHVIEYAIARGIDRVSWPATVEQVFDIEGWGDTEYTPRSLPNGQLNFDITLGSNDMDTRIKEKEAWDESVKRGIPKTLREYYKPITDRYLKLGDRLAKRLKKYNPKIEKIPIAVNKSTDYDQRVAVLEYESGKQALKVRNSLPARLKKFAGVQYNRIDVKIPEDLWQDFAEAAKVRKLGVGEDNIVYGTMRKHHGGLIHSMSHHPEKDSEDLVWSMEINDKMKKASQEGRLTYKYSVQKRQPSTYQLDKSGSVKYPPFTPARVPKVGTGIARLPKPLLTTHDDDEWRKVVPQVTGSPNTLELSAKAIDNLDTILKKHPTPLADLHSWTAFYADVMASREVPVAPEQLMNYINNPREAARMLKQLTPEQIAAAMNGLAGSLKVLDLYRKGKATPVHTGQYLLWGILSRGISAYPHEAAFMDLVTNGVKPFIEKAAQGNYTAKDEREFKNFVRKMFDNLEGSPGKPATQNINSFGASKKTGDAVTRSLLYKFAEREADGRTKLQAFHDLLASDASGKDIRRAFHKLVRKPGIDNKVLSFILLVTGRHDVVIMDRIQAGHFWNVQGNKDKFKTGNLYDGYGIPGRPKSEATGLVKLFEGPRGLAIYEAAEKELAKILPNAFKQAGINLPRGGKDYVGPFHWLTWVLTSQQVVGHDTLDAVTRDIKNAADPYNKVAVMEGKMNRWHYGVKYGIANGQPAYILTTSTGKQILTNKAGFTEYVDTLKAHGSRKKVENRIVPHGIKPNNEATIYNRGVTDHPLTNRVHLDNLIRGIARRHPIEAGDRRRTGGAGRPGLAVPPAERGRTLPKFSVQAATRIQEIEGYADPDLEAETSQNDKDSVLAKVKGTLGRKSQQTVYFGNKQTLRDRQGLELDEAYQGRAVRIAVDNLWNKLVGDAWDSQAGFKLPKWFRVGKWARRLKDFRKVALPLAAHLNAINKESGQFTFADFNMRAGLMTEKEFQKKGYAPGDTITVKNELTGNLEELVIGGFIADQGRAGYQLERPISAETQQELYNEFSERYPDLIWAVDTFIDPSLKNQRTTISGVEVPVFNRFSLEEFMKEGNATFEGLPGYTPDVLVTRSMLGALRGVFNPKAGSRSPGRKYKTGTAREGAVKPGEDDVYTRRRVGGPMDLFEGFSVRAFQVLREKARKEYFKNIIKHATEPVSGGKVKPGYVTLQTGMGQVMDAIKAFQWFESPGKWVKTSLDAAEVPSGDDIMVVEGVVYRFEKKFPEIEERLSKKGNPFRDYDKFLAEAYEMRGQERQIPKKLVDLLTQGYAAEKTHGLLYRMGAWVIRNSTQSLLAHPFTYVVNTLSNDAFTVEAITKHGIAGLAKLPFDRPAAMEDLTYAKDLLLSQFYKFHGIRKLLGWQTKFETFVEEVMPDDVFEGSTALADLKIQYHVGPMEYLKRGEVGAAALQAIQYGTIDVRAKQRLAYAFLKAKAVRAAKEKGLKGEALRNEIDAYMARPPKADRLQAIELAQFEYLNYSDSPDILQRFAGNDYSRLLIPFPRFGYHWTAKQIQRVAAVKDVFGKQVPKGRRAEALADFITFGLFTAGGIGFLLDSILTGGEDDDEIRERIGTARSLYYDENGELKSKALPRQLVTSNRVNLSEYFRILGIDDGDGEDFWWRVRQYPQISMAGALLMAWEDGKKVSEKKGAAAGLTAGIQTYAGQAKDMMSDFFTLGGGIKTVEKTARAMTERPGDRPQQMFLDPYASNVPFRFYVTDQAMTAFVPFRRQFDTVSLMLDPVMRRKTQSKTMDYYPGAWEAIQMGHATGLGRRLLDSLGLMEVEPLMAQGTPKDIAYEPSRREKDETSRYRTEAMGILARKEPEARLFQNQAANWRLGVIPQETRTTIRPEFQALGLAGFNVRPIPRNEYLKALQPPSQR